MVILKKKNFWGLQSVVFNIGQKMALRAFYVVVFNGIQSFSEHRSFERRPSERAFMIKERRSENIPGRWARALE